MEAIKRASKAYHLKAATEEKGDAAKELRRLVLALPASEVEALGGEGSDPAECVSSLLLGSRAGLVVGESAVDASRAAALHLAIYKRSLKLLSGAAALSEEQASRLVSALETELSGMVSPVDISEVVDAAMEVFECDSPNACAVLDLLPKALLLIGSMGSDVELPGEGGYSNYCQGVVQRVCQHDWPPQRIAKVLLALRDFPLTQESLQEAVRKGIARSKAADVQDLPAIVHQLLMLAAKGCRDTVLLEVVRLFEQREAALLGSNRGGGGGNTSPGGGSGVARRQLLEVEGSVLLHMDMAVKHDAELGQAWLRYLRSDTPCCSAFMLAVSFMMAASQRFEQPVTDALKALVMSALKDAAALAASPWLPAPSSQGLPAGETATGPSYAALRDALLQCVRNSAHGHGAIVQPMAGLAAMLMEAGGGADKGATYRPDGSLGTEGAPPAALACDLGTHMLLELFRGQKEFRRDAVAMCHNMLIGAKEEVAAPFVRLIALLVRQEGPLVAEYMNDFKVSLENLAFLPPNAALSLLLAVWPLCRARRDVQDYVVMLLRKAMFSREVHARLLAARGFLYMIIEELSSAAAEGGGAGMFDQAGPSNTQVSMSQRSALSGGPGGATLLHELISFLRRCLSQQAEVRRALYDGMPAVLAADPTAQECIVEPLLPHFNHFYEQDEQLTPPLKLELCARLQGETVRVVEPLQHMLAGLRRVLRVAAPPNTGTEAGNFANLLGTDLSDLGEEAGAMAEALRQNFKSLRSRLVACTVEDFQIDQSTDFTCGTPAGDLNQAVADTLLGCMEVMMEDLVDEITDAGSSNSEALGAELLALFQQHQRLTDLAVQGKSGSKGKKVEGLTQAVGGRKAPGRPAGGAAAKGAVAAAAPSVDKRVPALSMGCVCKLLNAITDDGLTGGGGPGAATMSLQGAATMSAHLKLARDIPFQTFVLVSALRMLQACAANDIGAAIATGTAGSEDDGDSVRELLAVPAWQQLAVPLFKAVQTVVLACARQRVVVAAGTKKEKDPTEPLTQAAMKALEQLLGMGRTAAGIAALLKGVPLPDEDALHDAMLPAAQGFSEPQRTIVLQLPHFKQLLSTLVEHGCGKELESLCACLQQLAGVVPAQVAAAMGRWAEGACANVPQEQVQHPGAAKGLVTLALRCSGQAGTDVKLLQSLAEELRLVYNTKDEGDGDMSDKYPIMTSNTIRHLASVLVSHLDSLLTNMDWALAKLKAMAGAERGRELSMRQAQLKLKWEEAVFHRLQQMVEVCGVLVETRITGATCEVLLKSCTHLYKVLGGAAKAQFAPKGTSQAPPCKSFQDLVAAVNRSCTPLAYNFISDVHTSNHENDAAAGNTEEAEDDKAARKRARAVATAANRARRESKLIPNLIYQIEDYEKQLIRLSKTAKVNLLLTAKRSTNRDFKLRWDDAVLQQAKRRRSEEEGEEEGQEDGDGEEEGGEEVAVE